MTRRISISLPDEVAAVLDTVDNASAYIAEAIRRDTNRRSRREMFARHGHHVTDEGVAAAGKRLREYEERRRQNQLDRAQGA